MDRRIIGLKIEQLDSKVTSKIEGSKTTLMWAIIVLFLPMYLTIAFFLINYWSIDSLPPCFKKVFH